MARKRYCNYCGNQIESGHYCSGYCRRKDKEDADAWSDRERKRNRRWWN